MESRLFFKFYVVFTFFSLISDGLNNNGFDFEMFKFFGLLNPLRGSFGASFLFFPTFIAFEIELSLTVLFLVDDIDLGLAISTILDFFICFELGCFGIEGLLIGVDSNSDICLRLENEAVEAA